MNLENLDPSVTIWTLLDEKADKKQLEEKQDKLLITSTGTSGPATLDPITGQLNIPQYSGGGGGGTVTSVGLSAPSAFSVAGSPVTSSGTLALSVTGTSSQLIDGTGALQTIPTSLPPSGSAGGDLSGSYPNPTVGKLHGIDVQSGTPSADDVLIYGGSPNKWQHQKLHSNQVTNDSTVSGTDVDDALNTLDSGKVNTSRSISTTSPLSGGGDLSADRTLSIQQANGTQSGYLSSSDWTTFNNKGSGTVTGVSGTSPIISSGGTTPTISIQNAAADGTTKGAAAFNASDFDSASGVISIDYTNAQTASASTKGFLTSADWSTFNGKQGSLTLTTTGTSGAATLIGSTLNIPQYTGGAGGTMSIGGSITSATTGSVLFAGTSGVLAQDNSNLFWDNTNKRLGIATASPTHKLHVSGSTTASAASAIGVQFTPTLVASANGDVLTALNISPTFTNGAFTGLSNIGLRINNAFTFGVNTSSGTGEIKSLATNVDFLGITGNTGTFNFYGGGAYNTGAGITVGGSSSSSYPNVCVFWRSGFIQNGRFTTNGNLILGTGTADAGYKLDNSGTTRLQGLVTLNDGVNLALGSTNGTKIGTSSTEKIGFWNATAQAQPNTSTTAATRVGGGGTALTDTDTFDGYTIAKVVKALRNIGILS